MSPINENYWKQAYQEFVKANGLEADRLDEQEKADIETSLVQIGWVASRVAEHSLSPEMGRALTASARHTLEAIALKKGWQAANLAGNFVLFVWTKFVQASLAAIMAA